MRVAQLFQFVVRAHKFGTVEIEGPDGGEDYEGGVFRIESHWMKSRTIEEHAGGALADLRDLCGYARAARKSSEIDAAVVDGQPRVRILDDGFGGLGFDLPRAVPGIVRTHENIAVAFGSFLHQFDGDAAACARIKCVNDGPALVRGVRGGHVQRVTLLRFCERDYSRKNDAGLQNAGIFAGRGALPSKDRNTKQQGREQVGSRFPHTPTIDAPAGAWASCCRRLLPILSRKC